MSKLQTGYPLSGFTARDILLKDYKAFKGGAYSAGISSVGKSLAAWIQEDSLTSALCADALEKLLVEKNVDVIMVMTAFKDASTGVFHREILVHGKSIVADSIRKQLGDKDAMKLQRFEIADTALGTSVVLLFSKINTTYNLGSCKGNDSIGGKRKKETS